jgi:hypothetical protein
LAQLAVVKLGPNLAGNALGCTVAFVRDPPVRSWGDGVKAGNAPSLTAMLLPPVPFARAVIVNELLLANAATPVVPFNAVSAFTAVAILAATWDGVASALPDQYAKVGGLDVPDVVPSEPAAPATYENPVVPRLGAANPVDPGITAVTPNNWA